MPAFHCCASLYTRRPSFPPLALISCFVINDQVKVKVKLIPCNIFTSIKQKAKPTNRVIKRIPQTTLDLAALLLTLSSFRNSLADDSYALIMSDKPQAAPPICVL